MPALTALWGDDYSGVPMTMTPAAIDSASTFQISDRTIVIFENSTTNTTYTATVTSQPNRHNRTENITAAIAGGAFGVALLPSEGWATLGGKLSVIGSNAAMLGAAVNLRD